MKMNDVFPSKYVKADDLEDGDLTLTIHDSEPVTYEEFTQKGKPTPENKPVLHFNERDAKSLVLNKTNWKTITQVLGSDDSDDWCGKQITLFATQVESFGEMTMAVRVRLKAPKPAKGQSSDDQGDSTGFWKIANDLGISKEEARPIAQKAISGELTWNQAGKQLTDSLMPAF